MTRIWQLFESIGTVTLFGLKAVRDAFRAPFEFEYFLKQVREIGWNSLSLIFASGFALGIVMTLHTRSTLVQFGAEAEIPNLQSMSFFNEIGPLVAALLVAGRVGAGIGAELANMRATE
jgi:phospholipid/cholesterol/gamma-HCH transport system permease protein